MATSAGPGPELLDREAIQDAYLAAWNAGDAEAVAAFFTDDATYDDRGVAEVAAGRAAIRDHVASVMAAFPDLRFEVVRVAHGGDFSAGEWRGEMTHTGTFSGLAPTGRRIVSEGVDVATYGADGRIIHLVSHYDAAAIMRQVGLLPDHGSPGERALVAAASIVGRAARRIRPART
ncbi:MAG TPA: ester cyclase [Solirubrobacterales bacterium]|nr:ester cyclase [Solirubrobacterales bacterium]